MIQCELPKRERECTARERAQDAHGDAAGAEDEDRLARLEAAAWVREAVPRRDARDDATARLGVAHVGRHEDDAGLRAGERARVRASAGTRGGGRGAGAHLVAHEEILKDAVDAAAEAVLLVVRVVLAVSEDFESVNSRFVLSQNEESEGTHPWMKVWAKTGVTRSPTLTRVTCSPTATTSPAASLPATMPCSTWIGAG